MNTQKVLIITAWQSRRRQGGRKQGQNEGQDCWWRRAAPFIFIYMIKLNVRLQDKGRRIPSPTFLFFFVCLTVWAVVNILSPPLADGVKGVCCSPGQWRPHFYMWTAVNTTEWHTTKVGCAAALSLLNGTLAFNFARVSRTHTLSSISSPNVCASVCFISFQKQEIRQRTSLWDRDGRVRGWTIRQRGARYISQRDYLHSESLLC